MNHQRKDNELPQFVSPNIIKNFSAEVREEKKTSQVDSGINLNVGDLVKITTGTFVDYEGRVSYLDEKKQKVKIDVEFAGRTTSIDIPMNNCQKILV